MHVSVWLEYLRLNIFPEKKCSKWNCYFPVYPSESYRQASCEKQRVWPQVDSRLSSPFTLNLDGLKRKQMNLILREKDWWMVGMELWTVSGRGRTKDERRGQSCLGPQRMWLLWLLSEETRADLVFFFFFLTQACLSLMGTDPQTVISPANQKHNLIPGLPFRLSWLQRHLRRHNVPICIERLQPISDPGSCRLFTAGQSTVLLSVLYSLHKETK